MLLVWVLLMENKRRGLFFGKKMPIRQNVIRAARRYHGYFFAWAVVFTFWFHPMENTDGHLIGFAYMFLLLLQGSLFFTRVHTNRWWTLVQEVIVLVHGTLVALDQAGPGGFWPMFFFGFCRHLHHHPDARAGALSRGALAVGGLYVVGVVVVYAGRGWGNLNEIIRIPLIDYLLVFVLAGLIWLVTLAFRKRGRRPQPRRRGPTEPCSC